MSHGSSTERIFPSASHSTQCVSAGDSLLVCGGGALAVQGGNMGWHNSDDAAIGPVQQNHIQGECGRNPHQVMTDTANCGGRVGAVTVDTLAHSSIATCVT